MYNETIIIDVDKLRKDMLQQCYGAFFGGGYGGAIIKSADIKRASNEELIELALKQGVDIRKYTIKNYME
jgi:hypothetical protein